MARGDTEEPKRQIPPGAADAEAPGVDSAADDRGNKEAAQLGRGEPIRDIRREAELADHGRSEKFKDHFEILSILTLDALFLGFFILAAILVFHMILPPQQGKAGLTLWVHGWLTHEQLDDIKTILAGGIIAGLVSDHFKRRIGG